MAGDEEARTTLINSNLRYVVRVAKRYRGLGIPLSELVAEGNLGLVRAVDRIDPDAPARFISFAFFYIRQSILLALATQGEAISLPASRSTDFYRLLRLERELEKSQERAPTIEQIAEVAAIPVDSVRAIRAAHLGPVISLSNSAGEDDVGSVDRQDLVGLSDEERGPSLESKILDRAVREHLRAAIDRLDEREARVMRLHLGLGGQSEQTFDQIAKQLKITREGVRKLKERAVAKLRQDPALRELAEEAGLALPSLAGAKPVGLPDGCAAEEALGPRGRSPRRKPGEPPRKRGRPSKEARSLLAAAGVSTSSLPTSPPCLQHA